jgi:aspartate dehydrogenase
MDRGPGKRRIALIGYGSIGRTVAGRLAAEPDRGAGIVAVLTRHRPDDLPPGCLWCSDAAALIATGPELVIEAAGDAAFAAHVPECLAAGCAVLAVSVAALAVEETAARVRASGGAGSQRLASGAIGGLDALTAAAELGLDEVRLVQRKPPAAFPGEAVAGEERVMSDSTARAAALAFPRNSNIAAAVALAGIGLDRTRVQVVMDPEIRTNQAELSARGAFGELTLRIRNRPSEANPSTATLTALSILAALRPGGFALCPRL